MSANNMIKKNDRLHFGRVRKTVSVCMALLLMLALIPAWAEPGVVITSGGRLNMRSAPSTSAKVIARIKNGTPVEVLDSADGWRHIQYQGKTGYAQEQYIALLSWAEGKEVYSNGGTLLLREMPDENAAIVGIISAQQAMTLEYSDADWAYVSNSYGKGYIPLREISALRETPAAAAAQSCEAGVLQRETALHREADDQSLVVSTWPEGTGALISSYNKDWCFVQIEGEEAFGFTKKCNILLTPMPRATETVDESRFIAVGIAKETAEKALKQYAGFKPSALKCRQDSALSSDGIKGPMYRFIYTNKQGQYLYAAYVHALTGDLLYTGDYSGYAYEANTADLHTSAPKTTQEPQWWYNESGEVVWDRTPDTETGTDIGQSAARSIADRYLAARYPRFSQTQFSTVNCRHATEFTDGAGFRVPYYQFDYFVSDQSLSEQLAYEIIVHAYTKEIEYCAAASFGEGNG